MKISQTNPISSLSPEGLHPIYARACWPYELHSPRQPAYPCYPVVPSSKSLLLITSAITNNNACRTSLYRPLAQIAVLYFRRCTASSPGNPTTRSRVERQILHRNTTVDITPLHTNQINTTTHTNKPNNDTIATPTRMQQSLRHVGAAQQKHSKPLTT